MKKLIFLLVSLVILVGGILLIYQFLILPRNEKGALQVTSDPESRVFLDGKEIGRTPLCRCEAEDMLPVGEYTVRLVPTDKNLSEFQEKITIDTSVLTVVDRKFAQGASSEGSVITLEPLKDREKTELLVLSFPDDAEALLDANPVGTTPLSRDDITDSEHTLQLSKPGYRDKAVRIRTSKGYKLVAKIFMGVSDSALQTPKASAASDSAALSSPATVAKIKILETGTGFLRVRDEGSLSGAEIDRVDPGAEFELLDESDGWYKIKLDEDKEGWVSSQFAEKVEEEEE